MTDHDIAALGPAFAHYPERFRPCFRQSRTATHFGTVCRGLLSPLPRKSVEPIALAAGTAVRTLQEFLTTSGWDHDQARERLQRHLAQVLADLPADDLGTTGVIGETSSRKWGDQTPGVQRQYLGCVGKIDNGLVTVHVGVAKGTFQALLDAELYLPQPWAEDRKRCREAGIPDEIGYRAKWRIALDQLIRLSDNGVSFDRLTFDEGYGSKGPFLELLGVVGQTFVGEVPVNFAVRRRADGDSCRADEYQPARDTRTWERFRIARKAQADQVWRARVGGERMASAGDGDQRGDRGGEVLRDQRGGRAAGAGVAGGVPSGHGGARLPPGQAGGRADARRGAAVCGAGAAPGDGAGGVGVRRRAHAAAAGGKTRS